MQFVRLRKAADCPNKTAAAKIAKYLAELADFLEESYPVEGWIGWYVELEEHQILIERITGERYYSICHLDLGLCTQGKTQVEAMSMLDDIITIAMENVRDCPDPKVIHIWTGDQKTADQFVKRLGGYQTLLDNWQKLYAVWRKGG